MVRPLLAARARSGRRGLQGQVQAAVQGQWAAFGFGVNPDSPVDLRQAFRRAGFDIDSTRAWLLRELDHPAVAPVLAYKDLAHAAEAALAVSGVPATVVRATAFLELRIEILTRTAGRRNRPLVFGRGQNPINFVSVRDVAALVVHVTADPATRGQTYQIGGPDNLTFDELARMVAAHRGGPTKARHVPPRYCAPWPPLSADYDPNSVGKQAPRWRWTTST